MAAISYMTNLNINGSGVGTLYVNGTIATNAYSFPAADGTVGQVLCTNGSGVIGWGTGGGSTTWADGTNPYIVPCNSCSICVANVAVTGNICDADSGGCLGINSSPGAFKEAYVACIFATTCLNTTYADTICACASRKMVLPVGVNCY